jgi:adenylate cyclase
MIRLGLLITTILCIPLALQIAPLEILKLKTFDALIEKQEPSGYFTILDITEEDIQAEGGYPIPRQRLAQITQEIYQKGAIGIGYVLSFIDKDRFGGDEVFSSTLLLNPTIVATFSSPNNIYPEPTGTVILGPDVSGVQLPGYIPNIKPIAQNAFEGVVSSPVDIDNLVRQVPLLYQVPDGWVPSFGTQVLKVLAGANTYVIKTNELGIEQIRVKGIPEIDTDRYGRKWISWVDTPTTTLSEMNVEGKFVFVGITAKGIMPQVATPAGLLEPHKIQAALSESILIQNSPKIPDWHLGAEILILGFFCFFIWLLTQSLGVTNGLIWFSTIFASTGFLGSYIVKRGILLDFSYTLVAEFVIGSISFYLNFRKQYKLRQQIKKQFEHYLDPAQVKRLQDDPKLLKLGGEKKYCTYLFTDVRGFTSLSEKLEPEEVTAIMNQALTIQADAVQKYGGMVDKYIGDAMMAIFNAPLDLENHEEKAILAALQIQHDMQAAGLDIAIGIGINSGKSVLGNLGSSSRFDYTAIGDAVNTAARLESATKAVGVDLLIGETTANALIGTKLEKPIRRLDDIEVKGKAKKLKIYTLG